MGQHEQHPESTQVCVTSIRWQHITTLRTSHNADPHQTITDF